MAKRQFERFRVRTHPIFHRQNRVKTSDRARVDHSPSLNSGVPAASSEPPSSAPKAPQRVQPPKRRWGWSILWLSVLMICGVTGVTALFLLTTVPPPPNCQENSPLMVDGERLYCAQQAAATGKLEDLLAAVALVESWSNEHPLYREGQRWLEIWSRSIFALARQKMNQGEIQAALRIAAQVPQNSPFYPEVQGEIAAWRANWEKGDKIYKEALAAIKARAWTKASKQAERLVKLDNDYWGTKRFLELTRLIGAEQQAWRELTKARELVKDQKTPKTLTEAINWVRNIGLESFARSEAQAEMSRWSRDLLTIAAQQLTDRQVDEAIATASQVPSDTYLYPEAEDFVILAQATAASWQDQLVSFLEARAIARQILPNRPLYKQAQAEMQVWQSHIQDQLQIQAANAIAGVGNYWTFEWASQLAAMVEPKRPRRIEAQTQIANWRKQQQRIEDRPLIVLASQLAQTDTVSSLQAAISTAMKVDLGRPRRIEAQTLIAQWNKRVEVLEDQPILDEAKSVAAAGELYKAIEIAKQIQPGRVLYYNAQANIDEWRTEIQIAEDRVHIKDAAYYGSQGLYDEAIRAAARVRYGRPLYNEAQQELAYWAAKREALRPRPVEPEPEPQPQYSPEPSYPVQEAPPENNQAPPPDNYQTPPLDPPPAAPPSPEEVPPDWTPLPEITPLQ